MSIAFKSLQQLSLLLIFVFSISFSSNASSILRVEGGTISTSDATTFCTADDNPDIVNVSVSGAEGPFSMWLITDASGNIIASQSSASFDFTQAPPGDCIIWHVAFKAFLFPPLPGVNASDLIGWYALSNGITVTRTDDCAPSGGGDTGGGSTGGGDTGGGSTGGGDTGGGDTGGGDTGGGDTGGGDSGGSVCADIDGGVLSGGPFYFCAGNGFDDFIAPGAISLSGNTGSHSAWVVTDLEATTILGLPGIPEAVNFEGAGTGTCLIWHLSHDGSLTGAVKDGPVSGLGGCFDLSNSIFVVRVDEGEPCTPPGNPNDAEDTSGRPVVEDACGADSGEIFIAGTDGETSVEMCPSDGVDNSFQVAISVHTGERIWVILNPDRTLIGIQESDVFNFEGTPPGLCIICNMSYVGEYTGLTIGERVDLVEGCVDFSNEISVNRIANDPNFCYNNDGSDGSLIINTMGNPISQSLHVQIHADTPGPHQVTIFDIIGRRVFDNVVQIDESNNSIEIDASGFEEGFHFMNVRNGEKSVMETFIKRND